MTDQQPSPRFDDHRNLTVGRARVIWVPAWAYLDEGWCLPGGRRTQDFADAHGAAVAMDHMMQESAHVR